MQTPTRPSALSRRVVSTPTRAGAGVSPSTSGPALLSQSVRSAAPPSRIGRSVTSGGLSGMSTPRKVAGGVHVGELSNQSIAEEDADETMAYQRERRALTNQIKNLQLALRTEKDRADRESKERSELEVLVEQTQRENEKCLKEKDMWQNHSKKLIAEGAKHLGPNWLADTDLAQIPSASTRSRRTPLAPAQTPNGSIKANRRQSWYGVMMSPVEGKIDEERGEQGGSMSDGTNASDARKGGVETDGNTKTKAEEPTQVLLETFEPALLSLLSNFTTAQSNLFRIMISDAQAAQNEAEENAQTLRALQESKTREETRQGLKAIDEQKRGLEVYLGRVETRGEARTVKIEEMLVSAREQASAWHAQHDAFRLRE